VRPLRRRMRPLGRRMRPSDRRMRPGARRMRPSGRRMRPSTSVCAPQPAVCARSNPDHLTWQRCGSDVAAIVDKVSPDLPVQGQQDVDPYRTDMNLIGRDGRTDGRDGRTHAQTTLDLTQYEDKLLSILYTSIHAPSMSNIQKTSCCDHN
jgi:hypothetical protein